ncbi:hypothetical protein [Polymorphobacter fuscus]|uniref:Uncharacterized protein n=1 Tax=Sandarakinorhabdus fusca TaxID=1439888 RepID=A0A7C9GW10_9SPHN|nr:hypothetical protein [Polymorphobacter fuscus]KAB7645469.1 hypothetical protein F9290_11580 [Polymorphobacter fuscus]MQT17898.1 hypothetical protein [Polymorphobacter fuscus]NJC08527.1 hypothetical protein [Polymorphobacter fuscus]
MRQILISVAMVAIVATPALAAGVHKSTVPPKGNPATWVTADDADGAVLQLGGGVATVAYDITPEGRATNCQVTKPAQSAKIGDYICRLVVRRARYLPGSAGTGSYTMGWAD